MVGVEEEMRGNFKMNKSSMVLGIAVISWMICPGSLGRLAYAQAQKAPEEATFGMVSGTISYLQRSALPPDTKLRVRLNSNNCF